MKALKTIVLLLFFVASMSIIPYWFNYYNYDHNYDYSNVYEVTATVKDVKFSFVDPRCRDEYLELDNGEIIVIGIGGAEPDKIGAQRTLYTDGNTYEFSKVALVDNGVNNIIGCIVICIIFTWILLIVYTLTAPKRK